MCSTRFTTMQRQVTQFLGLLALLLGTLAQAGEAPKPLSVAGITLFSDVFFTNVTAGMKQQAQREGVNLVLAQSNHDVAEEARLIDGFIKLGVNAILISPTDVNKSAPALQRAYDKGVRIVVYNNTLNASFPSATVGSSQGQLGMSTGEAARNYIIRKKGGKARIGILCFDSLLPGQSEARVQGFLSQVTKGLPGVQVLARKDAWEAAPAIQVASEMIQAHPDLDLIFGANEGGTVGAQLAVKSAGQAERIKVFGTDAARQEVDMLLAPDDILQAVTAQQPFEMGARAVAAAVRAVRSTEAGDKTITVPGILLSRDQPQVLHDFKAAQDAH